MTRITDAEIDTIYDSAAMMKLMSELLFKGGVSDERASGMAWLLGSQQRRLSAIIGTMEAVQSEQEGECPPSPTDDVLELGSEVMALCERFRANRKALG